MDKHSGVVLFVSHDASRTGAPLLLWRFLRWFRENSQIPFRILVIREGELLPDFERLAPVDLFEPKRTLGRRILRRLGLCSADHSSGPEQLTKLRRVLLESNIGLIYSNTIANGAVLDFLSFLNCPVICQVHELDYGVQCAGAENLERVKQHTSLYLAVSDAVKRNLVLNCGIAQDRIRVIRGFIPAAEISGTETVNAVPDVRKELNIPPESKLVCACGSMEWRKGTDLFLQVARKVKEIYHSAPVHFVWVGGAGRREQWSAALKERKALSVEDVVHFVGRRLHVHPYYAAADVFLLPSREDAFPLVMLEAAWHRKPIVCFADSGGAQEFVQHDAGFVVRGLDVEEMAARVAELLSSPELCHRMGAAGRARVLAHHDLGVCAPEISAVIEECLVATHGPGGKSQPAVDGKIALHP